MERVFLLGHQQRGIGSEFFLGRVGVAGEIYKKDGVFVGVEGGARERELAEGPRCGALWKLEVWSFEESLLGVKRERELFGVVGRVGEWREREEEARVRAPGDASQRAYERAYSTSRREARARKRSR